MSGDLLRGVLGPLAPARRTTATDPVGAWAASGAMYLTGRLDGPPLPGGNGAAVLASALLATMPAAPGIGVLGERAAIFGLSRNGDVSAGGATRLLPTTDGHVAVSLPRAEDRELVPALVEDSVGPETWIAVADWCARLSTAQVVRRARLLGLAVGGLDEPGPADAVRCVLGGTARPRERPMVLDLTSLWAGPLCAHLLARQGAEVIKVESPTRPDGARRGPAAFFDLLHAGSRSVSLDLRSRSGRAVLHDLVERADVVLTSSRVRARESLGLDPAVAVARGTVWTEITAHGVDEGADRVGFGDDVAVAAGLVAYDVRGPVFAGDAIADPLTGLAAAAATSAALRTGQGWLLDVAMVRVARAAAAASVAGSSPVMPTAPVARVPAGRAPALGADNDSLMVPG